MTRYLIQLTPSDFYYQEMNCNYINDENIINFAIPAGSYAVGDLVTFDYGVYMNKDCDKHKKWLKFPIQRTYKIDEIVPKKEKDFFMLAEHNLIAIKAHYYDPTNLSQEEQTEIEVK